MLRNVSTLNEFKLLSEDGVPLRDCRDMIITFTAHLLEVGIFEVCSEGCILQALKTCQAEDVMNKWLPLGRCLVTLGSVQFYASHHSPADPATQWLQIRVPRANETVPLTSYAMMPLKNQEVQ